MPITLDPIDVRGDDRSAFVGFMLRNRFPFHVFFHLSEDQVTSRIESGDFDGPHTQTFWLIDSGGDRVGIVTLDDLDDPTPTFDLRLDTRYRGKGLGVLALKAITSYVFDTFPAVNRFEGQTREDNFAMRQVFLRCGFVKEAHYREAWPVTGGERRASVAYAILRRDWETGITTPVPFDDLGY